MDKRKLLSEETKDTIANVTVSIFQWLTLAAVVIGITGFFAGIAIGIVVVFF